jgi:hypothetical protein
VIVARNEPVVFLLVRSRVFGIRCAVVAGVFLAVDRCHMRRIFIEVRSSDPVLLAVRIDPFPQAFA